MKAVVLAAGEGTRLRPLTADKPKALVEVADRPLLSHVLDRLLELPVEEAVVVVGYRGDQIADRYGDGYRDLPLTYVEQEEQLGLANAVLAAEDELEDDFVLVLGDNIFEADLEAAVTHHLEAGPDATLLVEEVPREEASRYGVCATDGSGQVRGVVEKPEDPPSNLVLTGFYVFSPAILHACQLVTPSARGEYELSDAIDLLAKAGRAVDPIHLEGWRVDVGYPEDRARATTRLEETGGDGGETA